MIRFLLVLILAIEFNSLPKNIQDKLEEVFKTNHKPEFKQVIESLSPEEKEGIISYLKQYVIDTRIIE